MKRGRRILIGAVAALLLVPATSAAAVTTLPGVNAYYAGVLQASGTAQSFWYASRPYVNVSYIDRRTNSYSAYADARFYQNRWSCTSYPGGGQICAYKWLWVGQSNAPNINPPSGWKLVSLNHALTGLAGAYASAYDVCADVPWRSDHCGGTGMYGY